MARRPSPPDVKKIPLKVHLDPDIYKLAMEQVSGGAWVNEACRMRVAAENKKNKKKGM